MRTSPVPPAVVVSSPLAAATSVTVNHSFGSLDTVVAYLSQQVAGNHKIRFQQIIRLEDLEEGEFVVLFDDSQIVDIPLDQVIYTILAFQEGIDTPVGQVSGKWIDIKYKNEISSSDWESGSDVASSMNRLQIEATDR